MKRILIIFLALLLAACSTPAATPTQQQQVAAPVEPSQTAVVVVITATSAPSEIPSQTPLPTYTPLPPLPTYTPLPTQEPAQPAQPQQPAPTEAVVVAAPTQAPADTGLIKLDDLLGKGVFNNMTMTGNVLTLRCSPREMTFTVTALLEGTRDVLFYYRTTDLKRLYPGAFVNGGKMVAMGNNVYQRVFKGEDVQPNSRLDEGFLDFQFIALNKAGTVIDRSQKFEQLIKYYIDCPQ